MRKTVNLAALVICWGAASIAQTQIGTVTTYDEQLDAFYFADGSIGYYGQNWSATFEGYTTAGLAIFNVVGEGKIGDFAANLSVHCARPELSGWSNITGFTSPDQVPAELIRSIRTLAC